MSEQMAKLRANYRFAASYNLAGRSRALELWIKGSSWEIDEAKNLDQAQKAFVGSPHAYNRDIKIKALLKWSEFSKVEINQANTIPEIIMAHARAIGFGGDQRAAERKWKKISLAYVDKADSVLELVVAFHTTKSSEIKRIAVEKMQVIKVQSPEIFESQASAILRLASYRLAK